MSPESVVYCEGYYDRSFLSGWLLHVGCRDLKGDTRRQNDLWGKPVKGAGHFAFESRGGLPVRVVPCDGDAKILDAARERLRQAKVAPLTRVVVCFDSDANAGDDTTARSLDAFLREHPSAAAIVWKSTEPAGVPGIPDKQTLERLACGAILAAHPARASALVPWIDSIPADPTHHHKAHAWSLMAGWHPGDGCDRFYRALWEDPGVAKELEDRLRAAGAWDVLDAIAS